MMLLENYPNCLIDLRWAVPPFCLPASWPGDSQEEVVTKAMRFLLLNRTEDGPWKIFLEKALAPFGTLNVVRAGPPPPFIGEERYDIIIVDATGVEDAAALVKQLREEESDRRIVVMTASPTWEYARAAFEAGAIDYLPKTWSQRQLQKVFKQILRTPLPPWPR
jgi:CheY-like chemotaxis protein